MRASLMVVSFFVGASVASVPLQGRAQSSTSPQFVQTYRDWNLYTYDNGDGKVCYIASEPTKEEGNYSRRGPAAVLVAKLPMDPPNEQVSVQPGYAYLDGSNVEVTLGSNTYALFTRGEHAWAMTAEDDSKLVEEMKKGTEMSVRGTSTKETYSVDTYSLLGFTAAYQAMRDACG